MSARLIGNSYQVSAFCPSCKAITSFEQKQTVIVNRIHDVAGQTWNPSLGSFTRILYVLSQCAGCFRGGFAEVHDRGNARGAVLGEFYPFSIDFAPLPGTVPPNIQAEFREAERCAAHGLNRAASALFRSVLEKALKANGYIKANDPTLTDLYKRIDAAASDGVITAARQKRAHDDIRSLGNDVLHDDWREVTDEEVEASHQYNQRVLEDFYDDRPTVEAMLTAKGRLSAQRGKP